MPGLAGGDTDSSRGDGGASPSESAKGDAGADGGGGAHRGDSDGGGGGWSHIGEEGPGGGKAAKEGKVSMEAEEGKGAASGWGAKRQRTGGEGDRGARGRGAGRPGASKQGGVPRDKKRKRTGEVQSVRQQYPTGQGPGWNSKQVDTNGTEGYLWDAKTSTILWPDETPTCSPAALAAAAEVLKDEQAVQVAVDVFAGTQSMGSVYSEHASIRSRR